MQAKGSANERRAARLWSGRRGIERTKPFLYSYELWLTRFCQNSAEGVGIRSQGDGEVREGCPPLGGVAARRIRRRGLRETKGRLRFRGGGFHFEENGFEFDENGSIPRKRGSPFVVGTRILQEMYVDYEYNGFHPLQTFARVSRGRMSWVARLPQL